LQKSSVEPAHTLGNGSLVALLTRIGDSRSDVGGATSKRDHMKALCYRFVREECGQDLIEYGLLIGIITVAAITAITAIGPKVGSYFSNAEAQLP
jgi:pilus assembly protein Flp/PilA